MAAKKTDRCWPGYEPVPGKTPNSQGSCRPKAESKSTPSEKKFRAKRHAQLDEWQKEHKGDRRQAAQHLSGPEGQPSSQKGAAQKRKATTRKTSAEKKSTAKKTAKKTIAKKTVRKKRGSTTARRKAA